MPLWPPGLLGFGNKSSTRTITTCCLWHQLIPWYKYNGCIWFSLSNGFLARYPGVILLYGFTGGRSAKRHYPPRTPRLFNPPQVSSAGRAGWVWNRRKLLGCWDWSFQEICLYELGGAPATAQLLLEDLVRHGCVTKTQMHSCTFHPAFFLQVTQKCRGLVHGWHL